jgi:hypothetical protein
MIWPRSRRCHAGRTPRICDSDPADLRHGGPVVRKLLASPKAITLDIGDTADTVHGHQQLSLFNAHYDERCFLPIIRP